jgi:hypothetical protein
MFQPESTLLITFGASNWPNFPRLNQGDERGEKILKQSVTDFIAYAKSSDGLRLLDTNILDLFDSDEHPSVLDLKMQAFLDSHILKDKIESIIIYFLGHGAFLDETTYFLAVRATNEASLEPTAFKVSFLARTLALKTKQQRKYMLLDACHSGAAVRDLLNLSSTDPTIVLHREVQQTLPKRGLLLYCAAGAEKWARAPLDGDRTMFTGALLDVLAAGLPTNRPLLSFNEVQEAVRERIEESYPANAVRPYINIPDPDAHLLDDIPLFPNQAFNYFDIDARISEMHARILDLRNRLNEVERSGADAVKDRIAEQIATHLSTLRSGDERGSGSAESPVTVRMHRLPGGLNVQADQWERMGPGARGLAGAFARSILRGRLLSAIPVLCIAAMVVWFVASLLLSLDVAPFHRTTEPSGIAGALKALFIVIFGASCLTLLAFAVVRGRDSFDAFPGLFDVPSLSEQDLATLGDVASGALFVDRARRTPWGVLLENDERSLQLRSMVGLGVLVAMIVALMLPDAPLSPIRDLFEPAAHAQP